MTIALEDGYYLNDARSAEVLTSTERIAAALQMAQAAIQPVGAG
jgi:hypothetical protein